MSCGYSEERLAMWMDSAEGVLPVEEIREINRHLASCPACRETMAKLRKSQEFARTLRADAVNPAVLNQVHQRVMEHVADLKRDPSWIIRMERFFFSGMRRKYVLAGVGSLVLACGVALGLMWFVDSHPETTAQIPPVEFPIVASAPEPVAVNASAGVELHPRAVPRVIHARKRKSASAGTSTPIEQPRQIMVKLFTDDPSVVIYWTLDGNGESQ